MPLPFTQETALSVPDDVFNQDGLAVATVRGGRYSGHWNLSIAAPESVAGGIFTSSPRAHFLATDPFYPTLALETVFIWLRQETVRLGLRLIHFESLNDRYGPQERPFFCAARVIFASHTFVPWPGATYADEVTLDEAMGYTKAGVPQ